MRTFLPIALAMAIAAAATSVHASEKCRSPMADWKPRDAVTAHVTELGIRVERIRIDDGCYEARGRDVDGNRIELKLEPASLALLELKVRFQPGANPARYLPGAMKPSSGNERNAPGQQTGAPAGTTRAEIQ